MPFNVFSHAKIAAISVVVPKKEIRLEDELEFFDGNLKKVDRIRKMIGISARRVADENVTAADLCQQAAENLLMGTKITPESIDALIFISQSPDHAIPATACILQDKLGLSRECAAFDVNQGCTAYTYGLWLASSLVDSGACKRILVLVGECGARRSDPANRVISPIFGDCGTATLIENSKDASRSWFLLGTDGSGAEALMVPAGHARFPFPGDGRSYEEFIKPINDVNGNPWYYFSAYMDGGVIFNFTIDVVPDHLRDLMRLAHKNAEDIDWFVLHQANRQIVNAIARKADFPINKAPTDTFGKFGNQSGASLPSVICDQLCEQISDSKATILLSGFGVGLSWASAIVTLDHCWCSGIREYDTPANLPTPKELEQYWHEKFVQNGKGA